MKFYCITDSTEKTNVIYNYVCMYLKTSTGIKEIDNYTILKNIDARFNFIYDFLVTSHGHNRVPSLCNYL